VFTGNACLSAISALSPFVLSLLGLGFFPPIKYPLLKISIEESSSLSSIIEVPSNLFKEGVISTNSFWEFKIPIEKVIILFFNKFAFSPSPFILL